jgi:hypothetical protein
MNSRVILTSGIVLLNLVGLVGTFAGPVSAAWTRVSIKPQNVTLGAAQLQQFTAEVRGTSGTNVDWSISDSSGPNSGSISATGLYTAPATISSATTVTVIATSAANPAVVGHATIHLTVGATPTSLAIATTSLPFGQQGSTYTASLTASGGTTPYTWSISSGSLPAGVILNVSTGGLSGTPTASGTSSFTVQVMDSMTPTAQTATESLSITVTAAVTAVSIATTSLASGQVGMSYSQTLSATGGIMPYTWSLASGTLPSGLTLNASTGLISGTPTAVANATALTFNITDSTTPASQTNTARLTITITGPSVLLSWVASASSATSGYNVYRSGTNGRVILRSMFQLFWD